MVSDEFLQLLNRAIDEKEDRFKSYVENHQYEAEDEIKQAVQGMVKREKQHLEILKNIREKVSIESSEQNDLNVKILDNMTTGFQAKDYSNQLNLPYSFSDFYFRPPRQCFPCPLGQKSEFISAKMINSSFGILTEDSKQNKTRSKSTYRRRKSKKI